MFDAKKFHFTTGKGSCVVKNNIVLESYLLSEEEVFAVEKIIPLLGEIPQSIDFGYLETETFKFGIIRLQDLLVVFPVRTESLAEIMKIRSVMLDGGSLQPQISDEEWRKSSQKGRNEREAL